MVMVFLQSNHIWVNLDTRSGQGQVNKGLILTFLICENKDMFLMQNIPRIPMVSFFLYVGQHSQNSCFIVWRHHSL